MTRRILQGAVEAMESNVCSRCGHEIEGRGIQFRRRQFCSDECCEEFEAEVVDRSGPAPGELDADLLDVDLPPGGLGYQDEEDDFPLDPDDDFLLDPDDF